MKDQHTRLPMPFIVGLPNSGTELLSTILNAHSKIAIVPKASFIPSLVTVCDASPNPRDTFISTVTASSVNHLWPKWQITYDDLYQSIEVIQPFHLSTALRILYKLYAGRNGKYRYGDQTSSNLHLMVEIQRILPEAHFIHVIRDGRAHWLSEIKSRWAIPSAGQRAWLWATQMEVARSDRQRIKHYLEIRYEDLITAPEDTLRRICSYLQLQWEDSLLAFTSVAPRLAEHEGNDECSLSEQYMSQFYTNYAAQKSWAWDWHTELSPGQIRQFERVAGDILYISGYPLHSRIIPQICKVYRAYESIKGRLAKFVNPQMLTLFNSHTFPE